MVSPPVSVDGPRFTLLCVRAVARGGRIDLIDVESADVLRSVDCPAFVYQLAFSPDGASLAAACNDRQTRLWNTATGKLSRTMTGHGAQVINVGFHPCGRILATTSYDKTTRLWDVAQAELVVDEGGHFSVWRVSDWEPLLPKTAKSFAMVPGPIAFSPDGRLLALLDSPRHVRLLDAGTFDELASLKLSSEQFVVALAFDPQVTWLIAATTAAASIHVWDLGRIRRRLRTMELDWPDSDEPEVALSVH